MSKVRNATKLDICASDQSLEEIIFPFLNEKLNFSDEAEAHKAIHAHLDTVGEYIHKAQADFTLFDPKELKRLIKELQTPFVMT